MNRKKIITALGLMNVAVAIAAVNLLPRRSGYFFSYNSELERLFKHAIYAVPWTQVFWTVCASILVSAAVYLFVEGIFEPKGNKSPDHAGSDHA